MPESISRKSFARAGLLGNPSDGYNGKAIAFSLGNFEAEVTLTESDQISIASSPDETQTFRDLGEFNEFVSRCGFYGGRRLMRATIKRFVDFCQTNDIELSNRNFKLNWSTNIPRSVGMAGSSALITACLKGLNQFYKTEIDKDLLASIALSVETELLGIPAGLMDRVIQMREGVVYMDFATHLARTDAELPIGYYENLDGNWLADRIYVAWAADAAEPTEVLHNRLRERYQDGDSEIVQAMNTFASFAQQGRAAIKNQDHDELSRLIDSNYDLRSKICQLNSLHRKMIDVARSAGGSAKFCGSGGAIVGTYDSPDVFQAIESALHEIGCRVIRPQIV